MRVYIDDAGEGNGTKFKDLTPGLWRHGNEDDYILMTKDGLKIYFSQGTIEAIDRSAWKPNDILFPFYGTITISGEVDD